MIRLVMPRPAKTIYMSDAPPLAAIRPMLSIERTVPPDDPGWTHELKYDGYRVLAEVDNGLVTLMTRNGTDATSWFPEVAQGLATLRQGRHIIDGEMCVLDEMGRSNFDRLLDRAKRRGYHLGSDPAVFCAFDLLIYRGEDIRSWELAGRKTMLRVLLRRHVPSVLLVKDLPGRGVWLYEQACALKMEGIVSKRLDSQYESGKRSTKWGKVKRPGAVRPERFRRDGCS